ncbi:MAG: type II toxin-antitoxin system HicB family antitoxin [bacterium]
MKNVFSVKLPVTIFKEGNAYVAYSPALDLSTCGNSEEDAKRMWHEIVDIFFEEHIRMGTLEQVLKDLGWKKVKKIMVPPEVVNHSMMRMDILASV